MSNKYIDPVNGLDSNDSNSIDEDPKLDDSNSIDEDPKLDVNNRPHNPSVFKGGKPDINGNTTSMGSLPIKPEKIKFFTQNGVI